MILGLNRETEAVITVWKPKTLMERVIGSRSISSPAWSAYKTTPVDPGHLFSPPVAPAHHRAILSCPNPARPDAKDEETLPPPLKKEPEPKDLHTDPATLLKPRLPASSSPARTDHRRLSQGPR
jgi:hypothetical protein